MAAKNRNVDVRYQSHCIKLAKQIGYGPEIVQDILNARSDIHLEQIMRRAAKTHDYGEVAKCTYNRELQKTKKRKMSNRKKGISMSTKIEYNGDIVEAYQWGSMKPWPKWFVSALDNKIFSFNPDESDKTFYGLRKLTYGALVIAKRDWIIPREDGTFDIADPDSVTICESKETEC